MERILKHNLFLPERNTGIRDFTRHAFESTDNQDLCILMGALIAEEMRKDVLQTTGFKCSAGVAVNKVELPSIYSLI